MTHVKDTIAEIVDQKAGTLCAASDAIWSYAELGLEEHRSAGLLCRILEENGFEIKSNIGGMPTAFSAEWSQGKGPCIGFLAEYDALAGLSQEFHNPKQTPLVPEAPGHGCGHNTMGTAQALAVISLKQYMEAEGINGGLRYLGSPGEEMLVPRPYMIRDGALDGLDIIIDCHANCYFGVSFGVENNALFSFISDFNGKTAHAGSRPWEGRSALDGLIQMINGVEYLREHTRPDNRIHWVITDGGQAPNVVPDHARAWFYLRAVDDEIEQLYHRIEQCAEGAALMSGTSCNTSVLAACHQRYSNETIARAMYRNIERIGIPDYDENENEFARQLQKSMGAPSIGMQVEMRLVDAAKGVFKGDSSDVGDASLIAPMASFNFPTWVPGAKAHTWSVTACGAGSIAHKGIVAGAKTAAFTGWDFLTDKDLLVRATGEFSRLNKLRPYRSFLPPSSQPPLGWNRKIMEQYLPELKKHYLPEP